MKLKLQLTVIILAVLSYSLYSQENAFIEKNDGERTFHDGSLIVKEGVPFLTVKGDAYEMGLQYGVLTKDLLLVMDHTVDSLIESYLGKGLKKWLAGIALKSKIKKIEKKMPEEYILELKGMADGSGLKLKEIQLIAYIPQLFFKISCTSFILKNDGGIVHGRNLDWPGIEALTHFPLIVNYYKTDKIPVTVLTFMGYPGVYTGMNHNGLSMAINMNSAPAENGKKISDYNTSMPLAFKLRQILENSDELKEVDEMFKDYSSHAWFISVGSKKDNSGAMYELTRGRLLKNEMESDFFYVANLSLSTIGRYIYSPIWLHGTSNISREKKLKELNDRIGGGDIIDKAYQILINTENHNFSHDPFYSYCINNSMTIKSCIMDIAHNEIYFAYGERMAALNKYLHYNIENGDIGVYREKQEIPDQEAFDERVKYLKWYNNNVGNKKKLDAEDYKTIIEQIDNCNLQPAYKCYLLSQNYSQLKDHEKAFENAEKYIEEMPDYYHPYYNKFQIMRDKGEYKAAVVALEEMLQTSTINPYYEYLASLNMIKMYDKLLELEYDQIYIDKIHKLADKLRSDLNQYFIDKETIIDLKAIEAIEKKYSTKN